MPRACANKDATGLAHCAAAGGDDYELCFAAPPSARAPRWPTWPRAGRAADPHRRVDRRRRLPLTEPRWFRHLLEQHGYDHFARLALYAAPPAHVIAWAWAAAWRPKRLAPLVRWRRCHCTRCGWRWAEPDALASAAAAVCAGLLGLPAHRRRAGAPDHGATVWGRNGGNVGAIDCAAGHAAGLGAGFCAV